MYCFEAFFDVEFFVAEISCSKFRGYNFSGSKNSCFRIYVSKISCFHNFLNQKFILLIMRQKLQNSNFALKNHAFKFFVAKIFHLKILYPIFSPPIFSFPMFTLLNSQNQPRK
jgi:hypothetical protein